MLQKKEMKGGVVIGEGCCGWELDRREGGRKRERSSWTGPARARAEGRERAREVSVRFFLIGSSRYIFQPKVVREEMRERISLVSLDD